MGPDVVVLGQLARDLVLIVDVVDPAGKWRYLEDLPPYVLLTETDVAAASLIATASWVSIQLQQPPDAALAAARLAAEATAAVVLDGAPTDGRHQAELLAVAAAGATVAHPGGRPSLTEADLDRQLALM